MSCEAERRSVVGAGISNSKCLFLTAEPELPQPAPHPGSGGVRSRSGAHTDMLQSAISCYGALPHAT